MSRNPSPDAIESQEASKFGGLKKAVRTAAIWGGVVAGKGALLLTAAALSTNPEPRGSQSAEPVPVVAPKDETIGELDLIVFPTPVALPRVGVAAMAAFSAPASLDRPAASSTPIPALAESRSATNINIAMSEDEIRARGIDPYSAEYIFAMCLKPNFQAMAYAPEQPLHKVNGLAMIAPAGVEAKPAELNKDQIFECFNKEPVITKWIADTMGINLKDPKTQESAKAFESVYENLPKALVENGIMTLEQAQSVFGKQVTMTFKLAETDKDGKVTQAVRAGEAKILDTQAEVDERRARNEKMVFWKGETYNVLVIGNRVLIFRQDCANLLIWQIPQPRQVVTPPTITATVAQLTPSETPSPVLVPVTPSATPTQWTTTNQTPTPTQPPATQPPATATERPTQPPATATEKPATATKVPATPTVRASTVPQTPVIRTPSAEATRVPTDVPQPTEEEDRTPIATPARPVTVPQTPVVATPSAAAAGVTRDGIDPVAGEDRLPRPGAKPGQAAPVSAPVQAGSVAVKPGEAGASSAPAKPGVAPENRTGTKPGTKPEGKSQPAVVATGKQEAPKQAAPVAQPAPGPRQGTQPSTKR